LHFYRIIKDFLFRTPGTGLYDNLQRYNIPYPEAIFELNYFNRNPNPFFHLAKELYPGKFSPNIIHYFIRYLYDQNLLHRVYTQNIDGLERSKIPARNPNTNSHLIFF
jgi:NAD-dependent SIR2 family protein deacetylase